MVDGVIVLYDQNETSFTSNGLGYLPDATECTVIEELNGEFELEMEYPITGTRYDQIQHRRILYVKTNPYEDPQPFRIYNINKPIDGLVEVNARHISYDLSGYALPWISDGEGQKSSLPFATGPASAVENLPALVNQLNTGMQPFTYWTNSTEDYPRDPDDEKENQLKEPHWIFIDTPTTARNLLGTFTEKYKGEFKFDKFNVKFYGPVSGQSEDDTHYRGKDSGVVLRYGKNLTDLMQEEDSDKGMYTHIYPFWSGTIDVQDESESSSSTTKSKETVIELPNKLYPVNSSVDPGYKRIYVYDVTSDYTDELKSKDGLGHPSEETLKEMCDKLIKENKLGTPNITLTASFVQLSKSVEYSNLALLEKILLGDTVTVDFPKLDVKSTLKCTAIEYNVLTDEYKTITLGDERNTSGGVSSTIASTASLSASNSTAIAGSATKQDVYGKSYDTALSTTSENAVQNKVVTKAINNTNDQITNIRGDISNIITQIEGLTPGTGSITYGYSLPTGGNDGDAYVQLTSTPKDPTAIMTEGLIHNNFEVSNFTRSGSKFSFDISGTVDLTEENYAAVNIENLTPGREYRANFKINHNVPTSSLDSSYYYYRGAHWTRGFGFFINNSSNTKNINYVPTNADNHWFDNSFGINEMRGWEGELISVESTKSYIPSAKFQHIYKDTGEQSYDLYFTPNSDKACLQFVFDDMVDGASCDMTVSDFEITYAGMPIIDMNNPALSGSVFASSVWNDNWSADQGIVDSVPNASWTNWGGGYGESDVIFGFSFTESQEMDRLRLNAWEGIDATQIGKTVLRTLYLEGSMDNKAWNAEDKEWVNLLPSNSPINIDYGYNNIGHLYFNINKGTYHDIRCRFVNNGNGKVEALQCFLRDEIQNENHVKDLFFKCDGEWLVYPRDDDEYKTFGYGTEDPTEDTQNDIYAKLIGGSEPDTYDIDSIFYKVNSNWLPGPSGGGGGGGGREYLGDITPRVLAASPYITSSSYSTSWGTFYDWYAFNGVSPASYRNPQGNCWQGDGTNQWIQYQFNDPRYFTELELKCFSNYSGDWIGNIKVEGSSDGTNFTNILASGTTQQITAELAPTSEGGSGQESDIHISLDDTETWSYIRITFVEAMVVPYNPSCYLDEVYVYGGKDGGGGGSNSYSNLIDPPLTSDNDLWADEVVTVSSIIGQGFEAYTPFNGTKASTASGQGGWLPLASDGTPTLTVEFDSSRNFYCIKLELLNNGPAGVFSDVYIEGSSDGNTWNNILKDDSSVSFSLASGFNYYKYDLSGNGYKYFRIRGTSPFFYGSGQAHCIFSRVYIYGGIA